MEGVGNLRCHPPLAGRNGGKLILSHRPPLAGERVMHIGEPVAMVVADTSLPRRMPPSSSPSNTRTLTPVTDARDALRDGAPQIWPEAPGNLAVDGRAGSRSGCQCAPRSIAIFASAKFVARFAEMNQRLVVASMEPRGATASHDAASDSYTCASARKAPAPCARTSWSSWAGRRSAARHHRRRRRRLRPQDLGRPEYIALLVGAKTIRTADPLDVGPLGGLPQRQPGAAISIPRPSWRSTRRAIPGAAHAQLGNLGAFVGAVGANIPTLNFARCLPGMYDIKYIDVATKCVFTNTIPTAPYRGAGRPEASYVLERVVDERRASPASIRSSCAGAT